MYVRQFDDTSIDSSQPSFTRDWHSVDWKKVNREVTRLRSRIFASAKKQDTRNVKRLQKLMVRSKCNILYSVRRVTSLSSGRFAKGIDGALYLTPQSRMYLVQEIIQSDINTWSPKPVVRKYIPKPNGKLRPLGIPTIKDRVYQLIVANALEPQWEAVFECSSYGFRPKRSVNDCINRIFLALSKEGSRTWIVDADISQCFDQISHSWIMQQIDDFPYKNLIQKWLNAGFMFDGNLHETLEGTPQGGVISPLLCNIALHGLESELGVRYRDKAHSAIRTGSRLFLRYADDLLILTYSRKDAELALEQLRIALKPRGLSVSDEKTRIVHSTQGFDFLGFNIRITPQDYYKRDPLTIVRKSQEEFYYNYNKTLVIIKPSDKSILKFKNSIRDVFKSSRGNNSKSLIKKLNPIIRGWCSSKQAWHCNRTYHKMNHFIHKLLWRWMIRSHRRKNYGWMRKTYFMSLTDYGYNNNFVFSYPLNRKIFLLQPGWFKPVRHIMAKTDACPDDASLKEYYLNLEQMRISRKRFAIYDTLRLKLSSKQQNLCPVCSDYLFNGESLHVHHIIERVNGGSNSISNLILLHQTCHNRITYGNDKLHWRELFLNMKDLTNAD